MANAIPAVIIVTAAVRSAAEDADIILCAMNIRKDRTVENPEIPGIHIGFIHIRKKSKNAKFARADMSVNSNTIVEATI